MIRPNETMERLEEESSDMLESRRHRRASELRFASRVLGNGTLTDELRRNLWGVIVSFLFSPHDDKAPWASAMSEHPAVRRVWSSPPLWGDPALIPEDVVELLEGWFSLVEASDVYAFIETVHQNLEPGNQPRFALACNTAFERAVSDQRLVLHRIVPIASKADITTIERAVLACASSDLTAGDVLIGALTRLAAKPEPDARGAVQEAIRAVETTAFELTGERHLTLEETLDDLRDKGLVDAALESAHRGIFAYVANSARTTTPDDARLILVMCAGFVAHLASRAHLAPVTLARAGGV